MAFIDRIILKCAASSSSSSSSSSAFLLGFGQILLLLVVHCHSQQQQENFPSPVPSTFSPSQPILSEHYVQESSSPPPAEPLPQASALILTPQANSFQQRLLSSSSSYLPGLGAFGPPAIQQQQQQHTIRTQRSQLADAQTYAANSNTPAAHVKTPNNKNINGGAPFLFTSPEALFGASDSKAAANSNLDLQAMMSGDKSGKCTYVQMKGGPLPEGQCHKGGMACEKQCGYGAGKATNCRTVMEEVCEEVSKPDCQTVMEPVCETVQEKVCRQQQQSAAAAPLAMPLTQQQQPKKQEIR